MSNTYLTFLWLPQSLVPLPRLITALRQIVHPQPNLPHPLHELLNDILSTARGVAQKYHTELPSIISDGGGLGEVEEQMMWLRYNNEKASDNDELSQDHWTRLWLEKMERREVQIQTLLYMLKLSLPGPQPTCTTPAPPDPPLDSSPRKRTKAHADVRAMQAPVRAPSTPIYRLEAFMDKLSTWQLVGELEDVPDKRKEDRDWMQRFCEDVVEPLFKRSLPTECDMLRSKVFPVSAFFDDELDEEPESQVRPNAVASSSSSSRSFPSKKVRSSATIKEDRSSSLVRSRSRSLSVSLAEEKEQQEQMHARKRTLVREVSMSRCAPKRRRVDLISSSSQSQLQSSSSEVAPKSQHGETLVEETPVKPRVKAGSGSRALSCIPSANLFSGASRSKKGALVVEEENWELASSKSSPIMVFTDDWESHLEEEEDMEVGTPTKKKKSR